MEKIANQYIIAPGAQGDGFTLCDGQHYQISNCIVDFTRCDMDTIDEAIGITWGSSAEVTNCVFRGAGKLILCGSGDKDKISIERGCVVYFKNCLFDNFSRRGPEVQDGMKVILDHCLIRNWGSPTRFNVRAFGAYAHGIGSYIQARDCVFWQDNLFNKFFLKDLANHLGQAYNDNGIKGIFSKKSWLPGNIRALVASDGARVEGHNCYVNHSWLVTENCSRSMPRNVALNMITELEIMEDNLRRILKIIHD